MLCLNVLQEAYEKYLSCTGLPGGPVYFVVESPSWCTCLQDFAGASKEGCGEDPVLSGVYYAAKNALDTHCPGVQTGLCWLPWLLAVVVLLVLLGGTLWKYYTRFVKAPAFTADSLVEAVNYTDSNGRSARNNTQCHLCGNVMPYLDSKFCSLCGVRLLSAGELLRQHERSSGETLLTSPLVSSQRRLNVV
eukprot:Sspe_Gene.22107::Locus_8362_Transcript_1_2_Confidence_0.667_Length_669::g.22107::m.22107